MLPFDPGSAERSGADKRTFCAKTGGYVPSRQRQSFALDVILNEVWKRKPLIFACFLIQPPSFVRKDIYVESEAP